MTSERSETADDPKTVGSEFAGELQRCRELLELYRSIGSAGVFGAAVIKGVITRAEAALASGDVDGEYSREDDPNFNEAMTGDLLAQAEYWDAVARQGGRSDE